MLIKKAGKINPVSAQCVMIIEQRITLISIMRLLTEIPQLKYHLPLYGGGMGLWQKRLIWTLFGKQKGSFIQG